MDFSKYLFRCYALGHLMSETTGKSNLDRYNEARAKQIKLEDELNNIPERTAKGEPSKAYFNKCDAVAKQCSIANELEKIKDYIQISDGAKTHLMDIYISEKYGRKAHIENKYIKKGLAVEDDGITVYSRLKKVFLKKNEQHLINQFIKGTPDIYISETIGAAKRIIDIKCSWNIYTFFRTFTKDVNSLYYWQGMGYMWLSGADYFDLAYCLVNTPEPLIEAEKRSLWYKLGQPKDDNDNFINACDSLEKSMVYNDIDLKEKMLEYTIERNEEDIELLKKKITAARIYLNELDLLLANKFAA